MLQKSSEKNYLNLYADQLKMIKKALWLIRYEIHFVSSLSSRSLFTFFNFFKVLGLLWNLAHKEDVPTDIMDQALNAHIKILDYSCSQVYQHNTYYQFSFPHNTYCISHLLILGKYLGRKYPNYRYQQSLMSTSNESQVFEITV